MISENKTITLLRTVFVCDRCGRKITREDNFDEWDDTFALRFRGGFGSTFGDGSVVEGDFCPHCIRELFGAYLKVSPSQQTLEHLLQSLGQEPDTLADTHASIADEGGAVFPEAESSRLLHEKMEEILAILDTLSLSELLELEYRILNRIRQLEAHGPEKSRFLEEPGAKPSCGTGQPYPAPEDAPAVRILELRRSAEDEPEAEDGPAANSSTIH